MTTAYPQDFPCPSRVEGHSAAIDLGLVRTPMSGGNTRQRRSFRNLPHLLSLTFLIEQGTWASWLAWVNAHAWEEWIDLPLPGVQASNAGLKVAPTPVRFCSDLQTELVPVHRLWYWRVRVTAEFRPRPEDFPIVDGFWIVGGTPAAPSPDWIVGGTPLAPAPDFTNPGTPARPVVFV